MRGLVPSLNFSEIHLNQVPLIRGNCGFKSHKGQYNKLVKTMLKGRLTTNGFVEIENIELGKAPSWSEIRAAVDLVDDSIRPLHELARATTLRNHTLSHLYGESMEGRAWTLDTPNGQNYLVTERAFATWKDRGLSGRQPAILMAPVVEVELELFKTEPRNNGSLRWTSRAKTTKKTKVAMYSGSDQLGLVPNGTLIEHIEQAAHGLADLPQVATAQISPTRLRLDVEIDRVTLDTPQKGETIGTGFYIENNFEGSSSLRLGDYFKVLWCANGCWSRQSGSMLSMEHRVGGLSNLEKLKGLESLTPTIKDHLADMCYIEMDEEIAKELTPAVQKQWAIALTTANRAQKAVHVEMTTTDLLEETNRVLSMITDPAHSGELYREYGLRQLKTMTIEKNAGKLREIVTTSLPQQIRRTGTNAWAMIQAMNDQPKLRDVSKTIREFMPNVMFAMLSHHN